MGSLVCECGRELNLTDWNYGRCAECKKDLPYEQWLELGFQ